MRKIKKCFERNENKNTTYQNLRNVTKAVIRGKLVAANGYIKEWKGFQTNNLTLHLKEQEKGEQTIPKTNKTKKIIIHKMLKRENKRNILLFDPQNTVYIIHLK